MAQTLITDSSVDQSRTNFTDLSVSELYEHAIRRGEGLLAQGGALAIETGPHTGRSPRDKFVVRDDATAASVAWGDVNQPMSAETFSLLEARLRAHLAERDCFTQELAARSGTDRMLGVRLVTESPAHALFASNLLLTRARSGAAVVDGEVTILHAPSFRADPRRDGTRAETVSALDLARCVILIAGTRYAGEIKKAVFTLLQYLLPQEGIATMHCSANQGEDGRVALLFGLSGTGKTTLSTDPSRVLIGDDEHGWGDAGIFNFEGGSYAKVINLDPAAEPDIFRATGRFGTVLENVVLDPETRAPQFANDALAENSRAAFPISFLGNASDAGVGGHPATIIFLTADAFGVLPPVARMTPEQALYHFLSGYTARVAGTERGVHAPDAVFSPCFGAPFLPLPPTRYADLLGERIRAHGPSLWLVNTGWCNGPYGTGERIAISATRAIVRAIVEGTLAEVATEPDPFFGLNLPVTCPGVPSDLLRPWLGWGDANAYAQSARQLAARFQENFAQFAGEVDPAVAAAGPRATPGL
jgi:phosphoenolpyruvate carboxykinase (ATP)